MCCLEQPLIWEQLLNRSSGELRAALFLDRDGVINKDTGYVRDPEDVVINLWATELICHANALGCPTVVVSNQSGVGRGYFTWQDFCCVQQRIESELGGGGARLDLVLACGSDPESHHAASIAALPMRKPNPGMILRAAEILPIDLRLSILVGDRISDLHAAAQAGLAEAWYVADMGLPDISQLADDGPCIPAPSVGVTAFRCINPAQGIDDLMASLRRRTRSSTAIDGEGLSLGCRPWPPRSRFAGRDNDTSIRAPVE